jgi:hypothetical protein
MMAMDDRASIDEALARYRHFQECLLRELRMTEFGITLELDFEYIWDDEDATGATLAATSRLVTLALDLVQEVRVITAPPRAIVAEPERADWGLTEVALVRLMPSSDLLDKHHEADVPLHHLVVEWEGDRRVDVIFARLRVVNS